MNKSIYLILFLLFSSCSLLSRKDSNTDTGSRLASKKVFSLNDKAGDFIVHRESGHQKSKKQFITKREVFPFDGDKSKVLEQSIAISNIGSVGKKLTIMRPLASQYTVWFDGKKYMTKMRLKKSQQALEVTMKSPEKQWNGKSLQKLPDSRSVYCFFSQLVECVAVTGFLKKAEGLKKGNMNLYLIWDGYPYFQEQYLNIPNKVFTKAKFTYDGTTKNKESRFSLSFGNQVIFFLFNKDLIFTKQYWVSQGLTMVEKE